jgi:26S proteasome regulatory subunit N6
MASIPATTEYLSRALDIKDTDPAEAISILRQIIENPSSSSEAIRIKEQAISNFSDFLT